MDWPAAQPEVVQKCVSVESGPIFHCYWCCFGWSRGKSLECIDPGPVGIGVQISILPSICPGSRLLYIVAGDSPFAILLQHRSHCLDGRFLVLEARVVLDYHIFAVRRSRS